MKRTFYAMIFIMLLFLGALARSQAMALSSPTEKVPQLVQALQEEGARVQKWSLYSRKKMTVQSPQDFTNTAKSLQKTFPFFNWSGLKTTNGRMEISAVNKLPNFHGEEHIILFSYPLKDTWVTYIIYELIGSSWGQKEWAQFSPKLNHRLDVLFQEKGKIFACAQGFYSDKIDIVVSKKANEILSRFHAKVIEKVEEKTFESVSAYTNHWKDSIKTNGRKMNLQVGLRSVDQGTTVTIGTPIITIEY